MRLITQQRLGGPDVLELLDAPRPEPIPTEVLVRVHAAGINPVDGKCRGGGLFLGEPPFTLGWDVSGTVEELGFGVSNLAVGDEVLGMPWFPRPANAYAEFVTAPSRQFVRKPASLSHVEAAGLPLAGLTAWQALVDTAHVGAGDRVLVLAAAGGVGHLAVQIAKARGAYVIGTASAAKHDFVRSLGADELIDYTSTDVGSAVSDVDVVLDLLGGAAGAATVPAVRDGGLVVAVPGGVEDELTAAVADRDVRTSPFLVEPDFLGLTELVALIERGELRVHVERTFDLAEAAAAHEVADQGRTMGKLVLTVS